MIAHRILWSFVILIATIVATRQWPAFRRSVQSRSALLIYGLAAVLITINWFTYVWGVNSGFVVETSLGYFINPLVSVLFGVLILHERLRVMQWVAIGLATVGVLYLTVLYGSLPWIALVLAFSFGSYGLVKKKAPLGSVFGLALETAIMVPLAIGYLVYSNGAGEGALFHQGARFDALLIGTGAVTTIPLLFFAFAVQRIPLSLMGIFQVHRPHHAVSSRGAALSRAVHTDPIRRLCAGVDRAPGSWNRGIHGPASGRRPGGDWQRCRLGYVGYCS